MRCSLLLSQLCVCWYFPDLARASRRSAAYDTAHPLTMTGTVKEFLFIQPHPLITLEVKDDQGDNVEWSVEMTAPNHLVHYGWNGKKLKPGDQITVDRAAVQQRPESFESPENLLGQRRSNSRGPPPEPGQ